MKSRTLSFFLIVLLLIPSLALAQAWAGKGRAQGRVVNEKGDPVEGAEVKLFLGSNPENGPEALVTDKKGRWEYLGLEGGVWTVVITAKGYEISQGQMQVNPFAASPPVTTRLKVSATASIGIGDEALEAGDYATARAEYEKAMTALDEESRGRLRARIGETYLKEGNYAAARGEYERALSVLPEAEQASVLIQMGNSYQMEGNYAQARPTYERAIPLLSPEGQASVLVTIAQGYGEEDNITGAIDTLMRADETVPGNPEVIQLLADLLMREGRDDEAAAYMAKLPEDAELPSDMVLNMGIRLYNEGNMDEALSYFERAASEHPDEPEVYYYRGLVYLSQGRNEDAKADLQKLLELDPNSERKAEVEEFLSFLEPGG